VTELDKAAPQVGADSQADRLRTARAGRDLIDRIRHAEDVDAVAVLAEVQPPTSAAALGRSIKTAHQVVGAVQRARWEVFGAVAKLQDKRAEQGARIRDAVRDALQHDELSQGLALVLDSEDRKATQLLLKPTEVPEKPPVRISPIPGGSTPTDDFPRQGHKERLSREDAAEVLKQLLEHRDELEELTVKWRLRN
jgi:hypothetical protein